MADLDYDQFDGDYPAASSPRFGRYTHLVGAGVSLALLLGGVVWGYQLAMRDVTGIPVIRAAALAEALGLEGGAEAVTGGEMVANLDSVTPTSAPATEIDPAAIAPGTLLVQLGAYDNQDEARSEWSRLIGRFSDLMGGKALVVQPAQSGGKTFYRLRAHGFASDDDTRRFCTAMLAENATCIPVVQR